MKFWQFGIDALVSRRRFQQLEEKSGAAQLLSGRGARRTAAWHPCRHPPRGRDLPSSDTHFALR